MAKLKLSKNELKNQSEDLKRFQRYLPMLELKKQQLQIEIVKISQAIETVGIEMEHLRKEISLWVDVFAEDIDLSRLFKIKTIKIETGNIAGIDIPVFNGIEVEESEYDLVHTPLWVDYALIACQKMAELKAKSSVYHRQREIIKEELRITNQRVNLFSEIKIPQAKENIRVLRIYLGDVQTAQVVRGKIAKEKIEKKKAYELV
jgi:V/A-type H+-transporting ATPase subunit D